jgi:hypothetical protein
LEPQSLEGRLISLLLRVFGLGVFGYVAGSIASFLVERRVASAEEHREERASHDRESLAQLADAVERLRQAVERLEGERPRSPEDPGR